MSLSFIIHKSHTKTIKNALETYALLDRSQKIQVLKDERCIVPSTLPMTDGTEKSKEKVLTDIGLQDLFAQIELRKSAASQTAARLSRAAKGNALVAAVERWLYALPEELLISLEVTRNMLLDGFPASYSVYEPMLLLPNHALQSAEWQKVLSGLPQSDISWFYGSLCLATGTTHIAVNAPIPPKANTNGEKQLLDTTLSNILRRPSRLNPLYGSFGTFVDDSRPSLDDIEMAFWVSTRQNGITQMWAPLYTMFSRGNITEKARVLHLPSVAAAVQDGQATGTGSAAVDLYAGIGYFAFSYVKAAVDTVLCWELNPWSVEGMRRGSVANGWDTDVFATGSNQADYHDLSTSGVLDCLEKNKQKGEEKKPRLLVFNESNEYAKERIEALRSQLPPIRHVNCGLLPSSRQSWETAVAVLDSGAGGWLHVHENIAVIEIEAIAEGIRQQIQVISDRLLALKQEEQGEQRGDGPRAGLRTATVTLEHVEKVKTYAPGVMHCVLDICIWPN